MFTSIEVNNEIEVTIPSEFNGEFERLFKTASWHNDRNLWTVGKEHEAQLSEWIEFSNAAVKALEDALDELNPSPHQIEEGLVYLSETKGVPTQV